jgi:hypothetical protein
MLRREQMFRARAVDDVLAEIHRDSAARARLYRSLAEQGTSEHRREQIAELSSRLDRLYEELRISRMVTA